MDPRLSFATETTASSGRNATRRVALAATLAWLVMAIAALPLAAQTATVTYTDDFQSYGTPKNPPGWVDTSIGTSTPVAGGLYKTWPDPLQSKGPNVVYGTKQSSGRPEGNNPRIGTFSTLTTKQFSGNGRFQYRGRFIRTNSDSRIGFTFFSSYPEKDQYYLLGLWSQAGSARLTMQLFGFGGPAPAGKLDSDFSPEINKWYSFVIQADDAGGKTNVRAKFWLDTNAEPTTWAIDASDVAAGRLTQGRIGIWAAVKGEVYVDDLQAKSPVDHTAPVISVIEKGDPLRNNERFNYAPVLEITATDDFTVKPTVSATIDGAAYTSGTPVTAQGTHVLRVTATDDVGNSSQLTLSFYVDTIPPVVIVKSPDRDAITNANVTIELQIDDATPPFVSTATLNGANWDIARVITEERHPHSLVITVTDGVGLSTVVPAIPFTIDKTPPRWTLKANGQPLTTDDRVFGGDVQITVDEEDLLPTTTTLVVDGASYTEGTAVTSEIEHRVSGVVTDAALNKSLIPERKFRIDKTDPEFVVLGNGAPMKEAYDRPVELTIKVTEQSRYTVDAKLKPAKGSLAAITFPHTAALEDLYTLEVTVTDEVGHRKTLPQPIRFYVDLTPPKVTLFANGQPFPMAKPTNKDVAVTIAVEDLTATTQTITLDGAAVTLPHTVTAEQPKPHMVGAVVSDQVGHTVNVGPFEFVIDKTAPSVVIRNGVGGKVITENEYFNTDVTPVLEIVDETATTTAALLNNAAFKSGSVVSAEGDYVLTGSVQDEAGNQAQIGPLTFHVDKTAPVGLFMEGEQSFPDGQKLQRNVSARVKVTDRSPVTTVIRLNNDVYVENTPITAEALHTLTATMKDAAGNVGEVPSVTVRIDRTPPPVRVLANGKPFPSGFAFSKDILIDVEADDPSGIKSKWAVIGPANTRVEVPYLHTTEGNNLTVTGYATDGADNTGNDGPLPFILEKTPPTVVVKIDGVEAVPNTAYRKDVVITFDVSAGYTGRTVVATVNGQPYVPGTPYTVESALDKPHVISGVVRTESGLETPIPPMPFILDKTPPKVFLKNRTEDFPPSGHHFNTDVVPVVSCEDTITRCTAKVTLDGASWPNNSGVTAEKPNKTPYVLIASAVDDAGNETALAPVEFVIDKTPPAITILVPANDAVLTAPTVIANGTSDDAITLQVNGVDSTLDVNAKTFVTPALSLVEGVNDIVAIGTDQAQNVGTATIRVVVDTIGPQLSIRTPLPNACIKASEIVVAGVVSDPNVQSVSVTIGTNKVANALAADRQNWSATFGNLAEGPHTVVVEARDSKGHRTVLSLPILVDRTKPVVEVLEGGAPFTATLVNRPVSLTVRARDLDANVRLVVTYNNAPYVNGTPITGDRSHHLDVIATDCSGQQTVVPIDFTIDTVPPLFTSMLPANGAVVGEKPQGIRGHVVDAIRVELEGTSLVATPNAAGDFAFPTVAIVEGANSFRLRAFDAAGNSSRLVYGFTVKSEAPTVDIYESGSLLTDGKVFSRPVTLTFLASDRNATVTAKLDAYTYSGAPITDDGQHVIEATATDALNHSGTTRRTFVIDRTPPKIEITSPVAGPVTTARVDVTGNADDAVAVTVNGVAATIAADRTFRAVGVPLEVGENVLTAQGHDAIGNTGSDDVVVTFGGTGPGVIITSPPNGLLTNRPRLDVIGRVLSPTDQNVVTIGSKTAPVDGANAFRLNGYQLEEGENVISVRARGLNGQEAVAAVNVTADFTPPVLNVFGGGAPLTDDKQFPDAVAITLTATDNRPKVTTELTVDGAAATVPFHVSTRGGHVLTAIARDEAGNETRIDRTFFIGATVTASDCSITSTDPVSGKVVTAPSVTIGGLAPGAATVTVAGVAAQVSDGTFVASIDLPLEGENRIPIVCSAGDGLGTGTFELILHRVTGAPSVQITAPAEGFVSGSTTVEVRGTVSADVTSVNVNGTVVTPANNAFVVPNVRLAEGWNIVVATAKNRADLTAADSVRVRHVATAPDLSITSPLDDYQTGAATIDVSGVWSDLDPSTLAINIPGATLDTPLRLSDIDGTFRFRNVALPIGNLTITVTGRSLLNQTVSATVKVTRIDKAPWITINAPADNAYLPGDSAIAVNGDYSATGARIEVNGALATLGSDTPTYTGSTNFSTTGGTTPVVARLTDSGGNIAYAAIRVHKLSGAFKVEEVFPAAAAQDVHPGVVVLVSFSHPLDMNTVDGITLVDPNGATVTTRKLVQSRVVTLAPTTLLQAGATYSVRVATSVKNVAGVALAETFTSTFRVASSGGAQPPVVDDVVVECGKPIAITGTAAPAARLLLEAGQFRVNGTAGADGKFSIAYPAAGQSGWQVARVRIIGADGSQSPAVEKTFLIACGGPRVVDALYDRVSNELTIEFSKEIRPASVVVATDATASVLLTMQDDTRVAGTATVTGTRVRIVPSTDLSNETFTLAINTNVTDVAGVKLVAPFDKTFSVGDTPVPGDGEGYIAGEVYDATNGRPLRNAAVSVTVPATAFARTPSTASAEARYTLIGTPTSSSTSTRSRLAVAAAAQIGVNGRTDRNGRYTIIVPEGAHTIEATAPDHTTIWRQIIVPAGAGIVPIDMRLTQRGETKTAAGAELTLSDGGENDVTAPVSARIPAGALNAGQKIALTSVGAQSLAGLLPLGWSPLASAEIAVFDAANVLQKAAPLSGAQLTFELPEIPAGTVLSFVQYDDDRDEWRTLAAALGKDAAGKWTVPLLTSGAFAVVYPDRADGLTHPPVANSGTALQGVTATCGTPANPCELPKHAFGVSPKTVSPSQSAVATLEITGTGAAKFPSGTAVQAYVTEVLNLPGGGTVLDAPFATDVLLYRTLSGTHGVAKFNIAPSAKAKQYVIKDGVDHIQILHYPGRLDRGTLIGSEGGRVPGDDAASVEIPSGATLTELHASSRGLTAAERGTYAPIQGFEIVGGFELSLAAATPQTAPDLDQDGVPEPVGRVELTRPARVTVTVDASALPKPDAQIVLAEVLEETPWTRIVRLAVPMSAIDPAGTSIRYTTRVIDPTVLPVDGVVHQGRFLVLAAKSDLAWATGTLRHGTAGPYVRDGRIGSFVRPEGLELGVRDLTRESGLFAVPVVAAPSTWSIVPRSKDAGSGQSIDATEAATRDQVIRLGDVILQALPPRVESITPAAGAQIELKEEPVVVRIDFSMPIDSASAAAAITLTDARTETAVSGDVNVANDVVTFRPRQPLVAGSTYHISIAPSLRGSNGVPFEQLYTSSFSTKAVIPNVTIHADRVHITLPDANGVARIYGDPGALPAGWLAIPVRRGNDFVQRYNKSVNTDGSFEIWIKDGPAEDRVTIDDIIDLQVANSAGNIAALIRLTPFVTADGRGFVAPAGIATTFTSKDGVTLKVPAGAFPKATLITVTMPANNDEFNVVPGIHDDMRLQRAVRVDFEGNAREPLELTFPPLPSDAPRDVPYLLGMLYQSVRGPRVAILDTLRLDGDRLTTSATPSTGNARRSVATNSGAGADVAKNCMSSLTGKGLFAPLDLRVPTGSQLGFAIISDIAASVEIMQEQWRSLVQPDFTFTRRKNCVAVPIQKGVPFTITGVDALTGLDIFKKVYPAIPITDPGVTFAIENPNPDRTGPYPLYAVPFRVEPLRMATSIFKGKGYELRFDEGFTQVTFTANPEGTQEKDRLPKQTLVRIYNVTKSLLSGEQFVGEDGSLSFGIEADRGDDLVVYLAEDKVGSDTAVNVVFSEPIHIGNIPPGAVPAIRDNLIDDYLRARVKLELVQPELTTELTEQARYSVDSQNRRMIVTLPASLVRGGRYRLTLKKELGDPVGNNLGEKKDADNNRIGNGGTLDMTFEWTVRTNPNQVLGQFRLRPAQGYAGGMLRDLAKYGNLAFVAADDGGVLAYDLADPAALRTSSAGQEPLPVAFVPTKHMPQGGVVDQHWSVAVDQHGRLFSGALLPSFAIVRSYRVEDFLAARDTSTSLDCPAPTLGDPPALPHSNCRFKGATVVSWRPGYASALPMSTFIAFGNQAESYPRKIEVLTQDDTRRYNGLTGPGGLQGAPTAFTVSSPEPVGDSEMVSVDLTFTYNAIHGSGAYLGQRITVVNTDLDLRWHVDAYAGESAVVENVIMRPTDRILVARNRTTYGLVDMFGHGVGLFDLNAIESNDVKIRCTNAAFRAAHSAACTEAGTRKEKLERLMTTDGSGKASCTPFRVPANGIPNVNFSPTAHALIPKRLNSAGEAVYDKMRIFALDHSRGVLDMNYTLPTEVDTTPENCVIRPTLGLPLYNRMTEEAHPRLQTIVDAIGNRSTRLADAAMFHWEVTAQDNAKGLRGSQPGQAAKRDYLLVAGNYLGLLVIEVGGTQPPNGPGYSISDKDHLVDVIWIPTGAVAVRTIPNSNLVSVLDGKGRLLLVDLANIDQRWVPNADADQPDTMRVDVPFEITQEALDGSGAPGEVGVDDPRIVFKSTYTFASRPLAPLVDPHTGIAFGGQMVTNEMKVAAVLDPLVEVMVDAGKGLQPSGGIVPLGVEPPLKDATIPEGEPGREYPAGGLAAFRVRVSLPGAIARSLPNNRLDLAIESERVFGSDTEQTAEGLPRAHLRRKDRANADAVRPVDFTVRWAIPSGSTPEEQAAFERTYRHQQGYNRLLSPWIVAVADPRASEHVEGSLEEKKEAGCLSCARPVQLRGKDEAEDQVYELFTKGRFIAIRPGNISSSSAYAYLTQQERFEARVPTTIADTVREKKVIVAAQNPPVATGMLQETTYVHSGEVEINALDLMLAGRAGVDVPLARTHRSRTLGGNVLGLGWEAPFLRRLRALPNGKVEYRDGIGEIWTFEPEQVNPSAIPTASTAETVDRLIGTRVKYKSPAGLFLKLVRHANGWMMFDQQWRVASYDHFGRLVSESDEFWSPNNPTHGNVVQYAYNSDGQLSQIIDPVGRITKFTYWTSASSNSATCFSLGNRTNPCTYPGLLGEIEDWRQRKVTFEYDSHGRLIGVQLPNTKSPDGAPPATDFSTPDKRPRVQYVYQEVEAPEAAEPLPSPRYTKFMLLAGNVEAIYDPQEELPGGTYVPRVKWQYWGVSSDRDKVRRQVWPCANWDGETCGERAAEITYESASKTVVTDVLGQSREYDFREWTDEGKDQRYHLTKETLKAPVMRKAYPSLPAEIGVNEAPEPQFDVVTSFNDYDEEGMFKLVTLPSLLRRHYTSIPARNGAPGRIGTVIREELADQQRVTNIVYADDPAKPNSANSVAAVERQQNGETVKRDAQTPSRETKVVQERDADAAIAKETTYDDAGRPKKVEQRQNSGDGAPESGTLVTAREITYFADDGDAAEIERGRASAIESGELQTTITYGSAPSGGQVITVRDEQRNVTTATTYDAWDRPIRRVVSDQTYGTLSDEKTAYDATGRVVFTSRTQQDVGTVTTTIAYDVNGRAVKTIVTGNNVLGTPNQPIVQTTKYDLGARTIIDTDPHVDGTAPKAEATATLDSLGRPTRVQRRVIEPPPASGPDVPNATTLTQISAYDIHGAVVYESDGVRRAVLRRNDVFGREIGSITTDKQFTETKWNGWDELVEAKSWGGSPGPANITSHIKQFYTRMGRLRATNQQVDFGTTLFPGRARQTRYNWENGGAKTSQRIGPVANIDDVNPSGSTVMRISETVVDAAGRVVSEEYGAGEGMSGAIETSLHKREYENFVGMVAETVRDTEPQRAGASVHRTRKVDGAGRIRAATEGGYVTEITYDEAGNVKSVTPPNRVGATTAVFDGRGLLISEIKSGGTVTRQYDALGNLRVYEDEADKRTTYTTDDLGRVTEIVYPDTTSESLRYDAAGQISARRDRANTWFAYSYDAGGSLTAIDLGTVPNAANRIQTIEYDVAKRITRIANKDAAVEYALYDKLGRPRVTRTIRYANGTGLLTDADARVKLDEHAQRHEWNVFDGERAEWTMPVIGDPQLNVNGAPWRSKITETWDAASNVIAQDAAGSVLTSATTTGVGRLASRERRVGTGNLRTEYGFADEVVPAPAGYTFPQLETGLLHRAATSFNTGRTLAGSEVHRDASRRIGHVSDLGFASRASMWTYDGRGRVNTTKLLQDLEDIDTAVPTTDQHTRADFREKRETFVFFGEAEHERLDAATAYMLEPLPWTATPNDAHAVATRTHTFEEEEREQTYQNESGRRIGTGVWTYEYDEFERVKAKEAEGRRIEYTYDPRGRIVGRTAFQGEPGAWTVEARSTVLARDGLPAKSTWVWDPVTDRLLAIYAAGMSVGDAPSPDAGLVRQYIHGDRGYDDPVEVLIAGAPGTTPRRYYPLFDEAGSNSLQAVVGADGNLVERVLYADAFGDMPRYLQGPVVDRITYSSEKDAGGDIERVDVRLHLTEKVRSDTVIVGGRLAAVKSDGTVALAAGDPELEDDSTLHWQLGAVEWEALTGASGAVELEIAVTQSLRAHGWGDTPVQKAPDWAVKIYGVKTSEVHPVFVRRSFTDLATQSGDGSEVRLYNIPSLYMAASSESQAKLLTDFHAYPFREPADGTIYVRARWYDSSTGAFLTPDPMEYTDSSNAYALAANDPVNASDPTGEIALVDNAAGCVASTLIGWGITELSGGDYTKADAAIDCGLGFVSSGLSSLKYLKTASRFARVGSRLGAEAALATGAEATRRSLRGQDYSWGEVAFAGVLDAAGGEVGAALARRYLPRIASAYSRSIFSSQVGAIGPGVRNATRAHWRLVARAPQVFARHGEKRGDLFVARLLHSGRISVDEAALIFKRAGLVDKAVAIRKAYRMSNASSDLLVIGSQGDTDLAAAYMGPGYQHLNIPDWTLTANYAWVRGGTDRNAMFQLVSELSDSTLHHLRYGITVLARELEQLRRAGYYFVGNTIAKP